MTSTIIWLMVIASVYGSDLNETKQVITANDESGEPSYGLSAGHKVCSDSKRTPVGKCTPKVKAWIKKVYPDFSEKVNSINSNSYPGGCFISEKWLESSRMKRGIYYNEDEKEGRFKSGGSTIRQVCTTPADECTTGSDKIGKPKIKNAPAGTKCALPCKDGYYNNKNGTTYYSYCYTKEDKSMGGGDCDKCECTKNYDCKTLGGVDSACIQGHCLDRNIDMCTTGSYKNNVAKNTTCVGRCIEESDYWGKSYCYTENESWGPWGGECAPCTCIDGIQNGAETDIDCGGVCNACPTCTDGIKNQDETAIDCGGACDPCQ